MDRLRFGTVFGTWVAALSLSACITVPSQPLDPQVSAARLSARTLDDPQLKAALAKAGLDEQKPWSIDSLTIAAWTLRADIAVAAADVTAGAAAERVAGELPNPTLSVDPGYLYDNANGNLSPWTVASALSFTIETGDKRGIRKAQAHAEVEARRWQFANTLWTAHANVRKAVFTEELAVESLALAQSEADLRQRFGAWVENQFRFGAIGQPERLAAQVALAQSEAALRTARGAAATARAELAASVGVTTANFPFADLAKIPLGPLPDPTATDIDAVRAYGLTNSLGIRQSLTAYDSTEQALRLAVAQQYPDLTFGPGYTYDKGDKGFTLSLGFTLPLFHGARAEIDQALAARAKAASQFEAEQAQVLSGLDTAFAHYSAAYASWTEARRAEGGLTTAAQAAERRLNLGAADRGEVVSAQLALVVAQRATLDALRDCVDALGALEDSVQRPIWPASALTPQRPDAQNADVLKTEKFR